MNAGPRQRMLDHRNDYSLVALGGHCCWLIVTLALVGGGEACRLCISVRARSKRGMLVVEFCMSQGCLTRTFFNTGVMRSRL